MSGKAAGDPALVQIRCCAVAGRAWSGTGLVLGSGLRLGAWSVGRGAHGRWDRGGRRFGAGGGVAGALALGAVLGLCWGCAFCCALMGARGGVVVHGWSVLITFTEICNIGGGRNAI